MGYQINTIIKAVGLQNIILEKIETCEIGLKYKIYCQQDRRFCRCNHCDGPLGAVHEWKDRIIRGPPVGAFIETVIYLRQFRGYCHMCDDKVRSAKLDFVHPNFQKYDDGFVRICRATDARDDLRSCGQIASTESKDDVGSRSN